MHAESSAPTAPGKPDATSIWLLCDGKPGHKAQLRGLAQALSRQHPVDLHWIDVMRNRVSWLDLLRRHYPGLAAATPPRVAIAAGHATHAPLLALGRASRCMTCVLMRPSLPLWCFDAAIIPRHDGPPSTPRVLVTDGVLNPIPASSAPGSDRGLIMLGGPSRHFAFPTPTLADQVAALCNRFPGVRWTATTSRRTPTDTAGTLRGLGLANLELVDYRETGNDWVADSLAGCAQAWITEDSVSMVYEALSAGVATGLITLPARRSGRLQRGLEALRREGMLNTLEYILAGGVPTTPARPLQEADRAAAWLLERLGRSAST